MIGDNQETARKEIVMGTKIYSFENLPGILEPSGRLRPIITCWASSTKWGVHS